MNNLRLTDYIERFKNYRGKPGNDAWGALHIVLSDQNVSDSDVHFCKNYAREINDKDGEDLADILLSMSKTQRKKLPYLVEEL